MALEYYAISWWWVVSGGWFYALKRLLFEAAAAKIQQPQPENTIASAATKLMLCHTMLSKCYGKISGKPTAMLCFCSQQGGLMLCYLNPKLMLCLLATRLKLRYATVPATKVMLCYACWY